MHLVRSMLLFVLLFLDMLVLSVYAGTAEDAERW